jgi:hypothetical protein
MIRQYVDVFAKEFCFAERVYLALGGVFLSKISPAKAQHTAL